MMVNLKVVETLNEDVFSELVRATNSQTKVDETQFYSLRPIIKKVEAYFDTYEGQDGRLYLERRERQFIGRDIPAVRVFSVHMAAKCVAAMFSVGQIFHIDTQNECTNYWLRKYFLMIRKKLYFMRHV